MKEDSLENRAEPSEFSLIKSDASKYHNKYVALAGFNSKKVIAYGKDPGKVIEKARKKGFKVPVIVYVPDPNITYILSAV
jgi:hypothetical protein